MQPVSLPPRYAFRHSLPTPTIHPPADVDSNLLGTGKVTKAAILGQQGGIWAQSQGYDVRSFTLHCVVPSTR